MTVYLVISLLKIPYVPHTVLHGSGQPTHEFSTIVVDETQRLQNPGWKPRLRHGVHAFYCLDYA